MIDKLLLTFCVGCLLMEVHAVPRAFRGNCHLPADVGPCKGFKDRYYFNHETGECLTFKYGGCKGNNNNFPSLEDCMKECGKHANPKVQDRKLPSEAVPEEQPSDVCSLPPHVGTRTCKAFMPRWTYDSAGGKCKEYIYGGCGGTGNLFRSKKECRQTCEHNEEEQSKSDARSLDSRPSSCDKPIESGPCFADFKRYGYNKELNRCEQFVFGGCGGNENNFQDAEECQKTCATSNIDAKKANACAAVKCDLRLYQHYAQRGCKPMYLDDACCPSYYECPDPSLFDNKCFYDGKFYEVGERIPEISQQNPCRMRCFCQASEFEEHNTTISCANLECPEKLGWISKEKQLCTPIYDSPDHCCASNFVNCKSNVVRSPEEVEVSVEVAYETRTPMCTWDGVEYVEGQRFYPKAPGAPCQVCTCTSSFNGIFGPGCRTAVCTIRLPSPGCVPIYDETVCCPYRYKCPSEYSETEIKVLKPGEATHSRDGPFITVGMPGKVPVSTLPIAVPHVSAAAQSSDIYERNGPFIQTGVPGKVPVRTLPLAVNPNLGEDSTYKRDGPFIQTGVPGKVPVSTLPIAVNPRVNVEREGPFIEVAVPGKQPVSTLPALVPQGEYKKDGPFIEVGIPGKVPVRTLPILVDAPQARTNTELDRCAVDIVAGPCKMGIPSYGFDQKTGSCVPFLFGGCKGNQNRFNTKEECTKVCKHRMAKSDDKEACTQEPYTGPCRAQKTRFFYNQTANECQTFSFGGCRSNLNNFKSKDECEAKCIGEPVTSEPVLLQSEPVSPMPTLEVAPYCLFGGVKFELGEQLATNEECVECTCSTPPELTCIKRKTSCSESQSAPRPLRPLAGGHSDWFPITEEVAELANALRSEVEAKLERQFEVFEPTMYKEQVVSGKNFIIKVRVGEEQFITVKIYRNFKNQTSLIKAEHSQ